MIKNTWPAKLDSVPQIRKHIQAVLLKFGLDGKTAMQLGLAVEEVTTNIVNYAYPGDTGAGVDVAIEKKPLEIAIHIIDEGVPFNPLHTAEPDIQAGIKDRPIGGLGLFFVKKLVDEISYNRDSNRNHLTLIKYIQKGEQ